MKWNLYTIKYIISNLYLYIDRYRKNKRAILSTIYIDKEEEEEKIEKIFGASKEKNMYYFGKSIK